MKNRKNKFSYSLFSGITGGQLTGLILGAFTWFYAQHAVDAGLDFVHITGIGGIAATLSYYMLGHALLGLLVALVLCGLFALFKKTPPGWLPASFTVGIALGVYLFAAVFVERNLSLPANIPLKDPIRANIMYSSVLWSTLSGLALLIMTMPLFNRLRLWQWRRSALIILALTLVYSLSGILISNDADADHIKTNPASWTQSSHSGKVVVIALDGATWQMLDIYSSEGLIPTIDSLRHHGVSTNLITHGYRFSPSVWTSVATGWSHKGHGIIGFTVAVPGEARSRSWWSSDRKKPALWQIASEYGKSSAAVHWWASYPAETINGTVVSRLGKMDSVSVYPREFLSRARAIVDSARALTPDTIDALCADVIDFAYRDLEAVFSLGEEIVRNGQPDLTMLYIKSTDNMQHTYWGAFDPVKFDPAWGFTPEYIAEGRKYLKEIWQEVDRRISRLLNLLEENTTVLILSDHGFRPRARVKAMPIPNQLLHAMGYLEWADPAGKEISFSNTSAFSGINDDWDPYIGIFINTKGVREAGIVPPDSVEVIAARLIQELTELEIEETGEKIFSSVGLASNRGPDRIEKSGADIYAKKGSVLRTAGKGRTILCNGVRRELDDFLTIYSMQNSGNHDPRGVLIGCGPNFKQGVYLPLVAESPYNRILNFVTGYRPNLERVYQILRNLGFLDPYTTLDVAPTVLYLLDLPVSEEMEGQVMTRIIAPEVLQEKPIPFVESYDYLQPDLSLESKGNISVGEIEQLRALGYIQ